MKTLFRLFVLLMLLVPVVVAVIIGVERSSGAYPSIHHISPTFFAQQSGMEHVVMIVAPILAGGLLLLGLFAVLAFLIRLATAPRKKIERQTDTSETQLIQELHSGFTRLEDRVEALETILMDMARNRSRRDRVSSNR